MTVLQGPYSLDSGYHERILENTCTNFFLLLFDPSILISQPPHLPCASWGKNLVWSPSPPATSAARPLWQLRQVNTDVEQIRHIQDSQAQILALTFTSTSFKSGEVSPLRSEADLACAPWKKDSSEHGIYKTVQARFWPCFHVSVLESFSGVPSSLGRGVRRSVGYVVGGTGLRPRSTSSKGWRHLACAPWKKDLASLPSPLAASSEHGTCKTVEAKYWPWL